MTVPYICARTHAAAEHFSEFVRMPVFFLQHILFYTHLNVNTERSDCISESSCEFLEELICSAASEDSRWFLDSF